MMKSSLEQLAQQILKQKQQTGPEKPPRGKPTLKLVKS